MIDPKIIKYFFIFFLVLYLLKLLIIDFNLLFFDLKFALHINTMSLDLIPKNFLKLEPFFLNNLRSIPLYIIVFGILGSNLKNFSVISLQNLDW